MWEADDFNGFSDGSRDPSAILTSQIRVRVHTGFQIRHRDAVIQLQARGRALKLSVLMMVTFLLSCSPYAIAISSLTPEMVESELYDNSTIYSIDDESSGRLAEGILIFTFCLCTLVNPFLYGLYVWYDNWHWGSIEARLPKNWDLQLVKRRESSLQSL
jgi:hypothetical protein